MRNIIQKNIFWILLLIIVTFFLQFWLLNPNNFFIFDDFDHLNRVSYNSYAQIFSTLPQQMYNDRPIGLMFIKSLYSLFGVSPVPFHLAFLIIHIINAILVYFLVQSILKHLNIKTNLKIIAFSTAFLFANYTRSTFTVQWIAAVFDLLACFFSLLFLNIYFSKISSKLKFTLGIVFLYLAFRSKESTLTLPFILVLVEVIKNKKIPVKNLYLIITTVFSLSYIFYLLYLSKITNTQNFDLNNPYHPTYQLFPMIKNLFIYFYLYTGITEIGFDFTKFHLLSLATTILSLLLIVSTFLYFLKNKDNQIKVILFSIFGFTLSIGSLLPFINRQQKLYLYTPSFFLALCFIYITYEIISRTKLKQFYTPILIVLISLNIFLNHYHRLDMKFWMTATTNNRHAYESLKSIPKPTKKIVLYNIDDLNTNAFLYGPGYAFNLFYNDQTLKTELINKTTPFNPNTISNACLIDYNGSQMIFQGCH